MKTIRVAAAIIINGTHIYATQRGYGDWKDYWEFPGGKIEAGETPVEALKREILEELETEIFIDQKLTTVEYDYPEFHLSMDCFLCHIVAGDLNLLEAEAAAWLTKDTLRSVNWLPADLLVVKKLEKEWNGEKKIEQEAEQEKEKRSEQEIEQRRAQKEEQGQDQKKRQKNEMAGKPAVIYIVRHGQTERNKANVLQGRSDVSLNDAGRKQAQEVRERFAERGIHFDLVYSSPLIRAMETARIIDEDVKLMTDERLIEMDYGPYEGMDLNNPAPEVMRFFRDFTNNPAPEGMEPLTEVVSRLGDFLEELRNAAAGKTILISTHAIAMKGALEYLTPESQGQYWSTYIENCAVYSSRMSEDGSWSVPEKW